MPDIQTPIRVDNSDKDRTTYTYACNGCGAEIKGYTKNKVFGHIWCYNCYKANRNKKYKEHVK